MIVIFADHAPSTPELEIRVSESESNPKCEIQMTETLPPSGRAVWNFEFRSFVLVSDFEYFEFRIWPAGARSDTNKPCHRASVPTLLPRGPSLVLQDLDHGGDVLRPGVAGDVVRGRGDVAAVVADDVDQPPDLIPDLLHRPERQTSAGC